VKIVRLGMMSLIAMFWILGFGRTHSLAAFVNNHDGTITDSVTGLVWKQSTEGVKRNWNDAVTYCEDLNFANHDDWRLPRVDELRTVANYLKFKPAADSLFVVQYDPKYSFTWSSTVYASKPWGAYFLDFYDGQIDAYFKTDTYFVRCVRGGPFWAFDPSVRLQIITANTVWDSYTSYAWQRNDDGLARTWAAAKTYCDQLELDGSTDWRLPTVEELLTIVDYTVNNPALSTEIFIGRSNWYWTSSSFAGSQNSAAWVVDFSDGTLQAPYLSDNPSWYVRCVRTAPAVSGTLTVEKSGDGTGVVSSIPAGIDCGPTCSASYPGGSQVRLTAVGDAGSELAEWNGAGCSVAGECVVTIAPGVTKTIAVDFALRYVDNQDGTVLDNKTGLVWQQAEDGGKLTWIEAGQYCETLVLGLHDRWRLPKMEVLQSIVDDTRSNPSINPIFDCVNGIFWSSSTVVADPLSAWCVDFSDGLDYSFLTDNTFSVRCVTGLYDIYGMCSYYSNSQPVSAVTLSLTGDQNLNETSGADGSYAFSDLVTGAYSLTPSKGDSAGADKAITSLDASLALQAVVHLITLTPQQTIAADVDSSGAVTAMDASYILQKVVGLVELPFPGSTRIWAFQPAQRSYPKLDNDQAGQNFTAILIGDVNGNWTPSLGGMTESSDWGEFKPSRLQRMMLQKTAPLKGTAKITLGRLSRNPEGNLNVPVQMRVLSGHVYSGMLLLKFDSKDFDAISLSSGTLAKDAMVAANLNNPGEVRIALASPSAITQSGDLFSVTLKPKARKFKHRPFLSDVILNDGRIRLLH